MKQTSFDNHGGVRWRTTTTDFSSINAILYTVRTEHVQSRKVLSEVQQNKVQLRGVNSQINEVDPSSALFPSVAEVYLYGAVATSWKVPSGQDLLFVRPDAVFTGKKPIR